MERKWVDILAYCASAALLVQREPPLYSSLRLLEVLEKLLRFGEEQQPDGVPRATPSCRSNCPGEGLLYG